MVSTKLIGFIKARRKLAETHSDEESFSLFSLINLYYPPQPIPEYQKRFIKLMHVRVEKFVVRRRILI